MKTRIIKAIISWLWQHYWSDFCDVIMEWDCHIHRNPKRKPKQKGEGES
ncbi:MAG: hypothetical protein ABIE47_16825 [Pseudomonadota bacterium]